MPMRNADVVRILVERWGPASAIALRCPHCRAEDGLVVRLHAASLGRCVYCGWRASLAWLLDPEDERDTSGTLRLMMPVAEVIY